MLRKQPVQLAGILVAAVVLALVTNAFAARQRKLVLPGFYPNAMQVPAGAPPPAPAPAPVPAPETSTVNRKPLTVEKKPVAKPEPVPKKPDLSRFRPHPDKPYVEISGSDVAELYAGGALILDARRTSVFEEGHIANARPFSVWESDVDEKVTALFNERSDPRDQDLPIVIYCSGGACEDSHMLAQKLWGVQFNNVYVYKDGFPDWEKRGGATRKGSKP